MLNLRSYGPLKFKYEPEVPRIVLVRLSLLQEMSSYWLMCVCLCVCVYFIFSVTSAINDTNTHIAK
jgi:hypothetical protein